MTVGVLVDKFYEMDPQFEDLIPDGTQLKDGMIVLIESQMARADTSREDAYEQARGRETNRWCTVSNLTVTRRWEHDQYGAVLGEGSPLISFIATYGDGTKKKRTYDASYAWLVKLDSISPEGNSNG